MKLTNKEVFGMVLATLRGLEDTVENKDKMVELIEKQIEQIDKKTDNKKLTKAQEENLKIKEQLSELLATVAEGMTISEIQQVEGFTEYSNQKLSALLNQLVKSEELDKEIGKDRKTVFKSLNPIEIEEEENTEEEVAEEEEMQEEEQEMQEEEQELAEEEMQEQEEELAE